MGSITPINVALNISFMHYTDFDIYGSQKVRCPFSRGILSWIIVQVGLRLLVTSHDIVLSSLQ